MQLWTCRGTVSTEWTAHQREEKGRCVLFSVRDNFCTDVTLIGRYCCTDFEFLLLKCRMHKKAQQRLFCLRPLRKTEFPQKILTNFYQCTIECVLSYRYTVWFNSCTLNKTEKPAVDHQDCTKGHWCPCPTTGGYLLSQVEKQT